jgi:FkbM family methyltransferase
VQPQSGLSRLGANFGTHTLGLAPDVGPQGRSHAFEPQRIIFNMLAGSVALSSRTNQFCYKMAVGNREGKVAIPQFDYRQTLNFGSIEFGTEQREKLDEARGHDPERIEYVPLTTVDRFSFDRVDMMKIDVAGMEMQVLEGAQDTIRRCGAVLFVEFTKNDPEALRQHILASGYETYALGGNFLCVPARLRDGIQFAKPPTA